MSNQLKKNVLVCGSGSFGTSLAHLLSNDGHKITLWCRNEAQAKEINNTRINSSYFPGVTLSEFEATADIASACQHQDIILFAIPCQFIHDFLTKNKNTFSQTNALFVNLAKGIEISTLKLPHQIFSDVFGESVLQRFATISGPTFAAELLKELPSGASVASINKETAETIQHALSTFFFRLYAAEDLIGVELGGALKNVMAICVGIVEGIGYGQNARAGLITRLLRELTDFGVALGAKERTFSGLSGIGDLILTCTGDLSRNRQVGLRLGKGESKDDILKSMKQVAEGVSTAKALFELNKKTMVDIPNSEHVYRILYEDVSPKEAVHRILSRPLKTEF